MLTLVVDGEPVAKARPRAMVRHGRAHVYTPESTRAFERAVALEAITAMRGLPPMTGPLHVELWAVCKRPKRLKRAKDPGQHMWCPGVRKDADNIAKAVVDGLQQGHVFEDDRQVCKLTALKTYTTKEGSPCTIVRVSVLPDIACLDELMWSLYEVHRRLRP